jgi:hypothetical protein
MKHIRWFLAVFVLSIFAGMVSAESVVSVEPEHIEVSDGDVFTVEIKVNPGNDIEVYAVQYDLHFDNVLLKALNQDGGPFLRQDGESTTEYENEINNTLGRIEYSEARINVEDGVTDPGILATIKFEVIGESGTCKLRLDGVKVSDPNVTDLTTEVKNGSVVSRTTDVNNDEDTNGELPTTTTAPTQTMQTPAVNQTPLQSPTASITSTAVQTPTADQIPTEPTSPAPAGTVRTPARNNMVPGFEASFTIACMLVAFIIRWRAMKK